MEPKQEMNMMDYLILSGRTAADLDEVRRDMFPTDAHLAENVLLLCSMSMVADSVKRTLFYKESAEKSQQRAQTAAMGLKLLLEKAKDVQNDHPDWKLSKDKIDIIHAALGLMSEAGEIIEAVVTSFLDNTPLDVTNLREEFGDTQWYQALGLRSVDSTFEIEAFKNIEKLKIRYPNKFTEEAALNRDVKAEKTALV